MALHTKKDWAEKCGMATNSLATYIRRGKVVVGENGMIDDKVTENKLFLKKWGGRQSEQQLVKELSKRVPLIPEMADSPIDEQFKAAMAAQKKGEKPPMDLGESIEWEKYWSALKREKENEKLELDNQKKRGEVIPSAVIAPLFFQHSQSLMTAFKITMEDVVRRMGKQYGMTPADVSEMRGVIIKQINEAMIKGEELTINALGSIVSDYQDKKGVGERN